MFEFTIRHDGREAGTVNIDDATGSTAELEGAIRAGTQRAGRIVLESPLQQLAEQTPPPRCCGRAMHSRGQRVVAVQSTFGELPISRRIHQCPHCRERRVPADAAIGCGKHRVTKPLAKRACQPATPAPFTQLATLLADQHGVTVSHDTPIELVHDVGGQAERLRLAEAMAGRTRRVPPQSEVAIPKRVWVSVDGIMYCANILEDDPDHPGRRRLEWQQMKVGCVAWEDDQGEWRKQLVWGRERRSNSALRGGAGLPMRISGSAAEAGRD